MRYYRIHSSDIAYLTKQPRGIFTAIYILVEAKILTEEETQEYWKNREYFEKELPVPPYYEQGNPNHAITWFKDTKEGNRIYGEMSFYRKMAAKYGLKLYMSECNEIPGEIVYEDDYQIAIKNQKSDLKIMTKEIKMIDLKIQQIFANTPDVIYGFADISYSPFSKEYKSALVFAVPYGEQLVLDTYTEEKFENSIKSARMKLEGILKNIEMALMEEKVKYYIPPVAQKDEKELLAEFSFKYAAVNAGLGWIGKNDVLITEKYGPRVRLSAVLIDFPFVNGIRVTESNCPATCTKCIDICPHKVLTGESWNINATRKDLIDYHLCNQKRSAYIEKHGRKNACGLCMVACPVGVEK